MTRRYASKDNCISKFTPILSKNPKPQYLKNHEETDFSPIQIHVFSLLMNRMKTGSTIKQIVIVHEYLVLELRYCHCCISCRQLVFLSLHSIKYGIKKRYLNVPVCFDIHNISHTRYYSHNHKHVTFNVYKNWEIQPFA